MLRLLKLCSFMFLFQVVFVGTAWSCLNDQELPQREREFRSDYQVAESKPEVPDTPAVRRIDEGRLIAAGGVVLLFGSVGLLYFNFRNQS